MTNIGIKLTDVEVGGQYHDQFYKYAVIQDLPRERQGQWIVVDVKGLLGTSFTWNWFNNNRANIKWEGLEIWVEAPIAVKDQNVPAWLPNRTYEDEQGQTQIHTFESWGAVSRVSLDNTKALYKITVYGDLDDSQLDSLVTAAAGFSGTLMLVSEARTAVAQGGDYSPPEV